jgi:hypothetical protein
MAHLGILSNCPSMRTEAEIRLLLDGLNEMGANPAHAAKIETARNFLRGELAKFMQNKKARRPTQ